MTVKKSNRLAQPHEDSPELQKLTAVSVRQPWASLIASGQKTIEVRSRPTRYRGRLLICASLYRSAGSHDDLPRGVAICIVDLIDCRPLEPLADQPYAGVLGTVSDFAWILAGATPVDPFPVRGQLGLFSVTLPRSV